MIIGKACALLKALTSMKGMSREQVRDVLVVNYHGVAYDSEEKLIATVALKMFDSNGSLN